MMAPPRPENVATVTGALTKPVAATACYNRLLRTQADQGYADQVGTPGRQRPHAQLVQVRRQEDLAKFRVWIVAGGAQKFQAQQDLTLL